MELIVFAVKNDWAVLMPIIVCSIMVLAVAMERWGFYWKNRRDVIQFISDLDRDLQRNRLDAALETSTELGGLLGEVSAEGIRTLTEQKNSFERLFDITANLATRKLERNLSILGTIATISPYLGLFGTVVRILLTFGDMAQSSGAAAPVIMFGIGSALIATAFGLGVAIMSVALNNYFHTIVSRWEEDFQILKLLFLSVADPHPIVLANPSHSIRQPRQVEI